MFLTIVFVIFLFYIFNIFVGVILFIFQGLHSKSKLGGQYSLLILFSRNLKKSKTKH
jgi:hypothetical protein